MEGTLLVATRGKTAKFTINVTDPGSAGYAQTLTGATCHFSAKRDLADLDAAVVFHKTTGAGITVVQVGSSTTPGILAIVLSPTDTTALSALGPSVLYYECVVVESTGAHLPVQRGPLVVQLSSYDAA